MKNSKIEAELERRLTELEKPENQGEGFTTGDWVFLMLAGVVGPATLLMWGW